MKTKINFVCYCVALASLSLFTNCAEEEHVAPTANRSGITSLTAYFTSGEYKDKVAKEWIINSNEDKTDYVIPIPFYYPEESNNSTADALKAMKVTAVLENNCMLNPGLTMLDLTQKNAFTYTDPYGNERHITISGQQVRSNKCAVKSFMVNGSIPAVVDETNKSISIVTLDDLSNATAEAVLDAHATIVPDPHGTYNFNQPMSFTVTADNGVDKTVYQVVKRIPSKLDMGYAVGSEKELFSHDLRLLGITQTQEGMHPTLAAIGKYVVLNVGDGSAPLYFLRATGSKVGTINLGSANATGAITSDQADHMLICNLADNGQTLKIYKTNSVTGAPTPFITYHNSLGVTLGARLSVQGDLDHDAVIVATPLNTKKVVRWKVTNGTVGAPEVIELGINPWGGMGGNAKVVAANAQGNAGCVADYYAGGANQMYYLSDWQTPTNLVKGESWGQTSAALDMCTFNHNRYLVNFKIGYWPTWGFPGTVYLFDAANLNSVTGADETSSALKYAFKVKDYCAGNMAEPGEYGFSDVLIAPTADGYFAHIFYVSNTHLSFGGIQIDCIKK